MTTDKCAEAEKELRKTIRVALGLCRALQMSGAGVDEYILGAGLRRWQSVRDPAAKKGFTLETLRNPEQFVAWCADTDEAKIPRRD